MIHKLEKLVRDLLARLGAKEGDDIAVDPLKVAMLVSDEINRRYVNQAVQFELVDTAKRLLLPLSSGASARTSRLQLPNLPSRIGDDRAPESPNKRVAAVRTRGCLL